MPNFYLVTAIVTENNVNIPTPNSNIVQIGRIKMQWADGMVGACPVFNSLEKAQEYKGNDESLQIVKMEGTPQ